MTVARSRLAARARDPAWRMVGTLAVTATIGYGVLLYAVGVFIAPMRAELHASAAQIAGAVSVGMAVCGAAAIPVGAWLDRHGARALMTAGSIVGGLAVAGWARAGTLPQLYAAFVGVGLASAMVQYEPVFATINRRFDRDRAAAMLVVTVVAGFASTVAFPSAQALVGAFGWRRALLVLAVVVAATAPAHFIALRGAHSPAPARGVGRPSSERRSGPVWSALRVPAVQWLSAASMFGWASAALTVVYLVVYLHSRGYSPGLAAAAAGGLGLLSVTGRIVLTATSRIRGIAPVAATMVAGQAVGVLALAAGPRPAGVVAFVLLYGAGFGVLTIARPVLLGEYLPPAVFARVSGVQALLATVGRIVAPVAAGVLVDATGGYGAVLALIAATSLAAAACLAAGERAWRNRPGRP